MERVVFEIATTSLRTGFAMTMGVGAVIRAANDRPYKGNRLLLEIATPACALVRNDKEDRRTTADR